MTKNHGEYPVSTGRIFFSYLAGFLDGDGSIFCRIVKRPDYKNLFQLVPVISFTQKKQRQHHLIWIASNLGIDKDLVRDRKDGISELAIQGVQSCKSILSNVLPFLKMKHKQGVLLQRILENLPKTKSSREEFLQLCILADRISELNDSKKRTITYATVCEKYSEKL
jgi:hypothetical protein